MPRQVSVERATSYEVYDNHDEHIGSTTALWMDRHNQPAFIGIKTTWLLGKTHVVPAWDAEVNHHAQRIRLPCGGDIIQEAPTFSPDDEMTPEKEREILDYYQSKGTCVPREQRAATATTGRAEHGEETVVPLHEEHVHVGKRTVEEGGVRLRKIVRTETVQQPVELQREEIQVERVPATGEQPSGKAFTGDDIYIPLRHEEPVVEKQTAVREAVRARKATETEHKDVTSEARKEDVEVERQPRRKAA